MASPAPRAALSTVRRTAASASLATAALGFVWESTRDYGFISLTWECLAMATLTGAASLVLLRRSVLSQVLARSVAWVVFLPTAAGVLGSLGHGHAMKPLAFALTSGAALLLSRPNLGTPEARREFAPVAYRNTFLAGAVAAMTTALVAAMMGVGSIGWGGVREGAELLGFAAMMGAIGLGVVRMRSWAVLLGMLTSAALLVAAVLSHTEVERLGFGLAALPGLLLGLPLVASRLRPASAPPSYTEASYRAAVARYPRDATTVRVRVSPEAEDEEGMEEAPEGLGLHRMPQGKTSPPA